MFQRLGREAPVPCNAGWSAVLVAALVLGLAESAWVLATADPLQLSALSTTSYLAALVVATFLVVTAHLLPAWVVARVVLTRCPSRLPWLVAAAAFGVSVELTMVQGDGVRSHPLFWLFHGALLVIVPAGFLLFTRQVLLSGRMSVRVRRSVGGAALAACVAFNLFALPTYRSFHGHLALFEAVLLAWLLFPLARRRAFRWTSLGGVAAVLALGGAVCLEPVASRGHVERLSRIAGPLATTSPLTRPLLLPLELMIDAESPVPPGLATELEAHFAPGTAPAATAAHGTNVVLIAVEAARADDWADPAVTPRFHEWTKRGLYLPRAVSPYPATPLAYGAIFTGHYPSVVAQSPHWAKRPLFGRIAGRFDHLFLSRPDNKWFDHGAITGFFVGDGVPVEVHSSTPEALGRLRSQMEGMDDGSSFFVWTHLYEPHAPYETHEGFDFGPGARDRYRSELRFVDEHLGRFLDWLWEQPLAEETLVVVLADHGEGVEDDILGAPFSGHHVHVHGVVSSIPMFLAGPGLPAGAVEPELRVGLSDVMPTIFDFLGEPVPAELLVQGESIYRLLGERPVRDLVVEAFSIRGGRFFDQVASAGSSTAADLREAYRETTAYGDYSSKIALEHWPLRIVYDRTLHRCWLFDLSKDPGESHDLAAEDPAALREMRARLERWVQTQGWVLRRLDRLD